MSRLRVALWLALGLLVAGCPQPTTPADVARQYLEALASGDAGAARALLADDARRRISVDELERRVAALTPEERKALRDRAATLTDGRSVAEFGLGGGDRLVLEHRGGDVWVVTGPLPRLDRQDTPLQALRTFARALAGGDFAAMLGLIPEAERKDIDEARLARSFGDPRVRQEVDAALEALLAAPDESGEGDRRSFVAGRHRADLVNEGGRWRIVDLR